MLIPRKRGWCPTLDHPMPTGDGLLVRVKPPGARLTPTAAQALATAAAQYGNGIIELTQRGNLQLRGLTETTTTPFAQTMRDLGLALPIHQESRRPVLPPPLLGEDPTLHPQAAALTARLESAFQTDSRLADLPPKFALSIEAGGLFANYPVAADLTASPDGQLRPPPSGTAPAPTGLFPYDATEAAFALAPPFGQLDATQLEALATIAAQYATTIRLTPWRALLLARIPQSAAEAITAALPFFITTPNDPRLLITACIGAPGCASATVATRQDALRLRPPYPIHVSGCPKGCAHPAPAPLTLVGNQGRYDAVFNGRANDPPSIVACTMDSVSKGQWPLAGPGRRGQSFLLPDSGLEERPRRGGPGL